MHLLMMNSDVVPKTRRSYRICFFFADIRAMDSEPPFSDSEDTSYLKCCYCKSIFGATLPVLGKYLRQSAACRGASVPASHRVSARKLNRIVDCHSAFTL